MHASYKQQTILHMQELDESTGVSGLKGILPIKNITDCSDAVPHIGILMFEAIQQALQTGHDYLRAHNERQSITDLELA